MEVKKYKNFNYTVRKGENETFWAEAYDEGGVEIISNGVFLEEAELKMVIMIDDHLDSVG